MSAAEVMAHLVRVGVAVETARIRGGEASRLSRGRWRVPAKYTYIWTHGEGL